MTAAARPGKTVDRTRELRRALQIEFKCRKGVGRQSKTAQRSNGRYKEESWREIEKENYGERERRNRKIFVH
jgi:hypothetical protein